LRCVIPTWCASCYCSAPACAAPIRLSIPRSSKQAGRAFWDRRHLRVDQDPPSSADVAQAQAEAYALYSAPLPGENPYAYLNAIKQPALVLNGVNDIMIASINSWHLAQNIPNAQLLIYPDAGHAAQFQYPERFLKHAIHFLEE
jgi:pimeloyl-ACP methyl ester carboxylesterase